MTVDAITPARPTTAQSELEKYQQKLAGDLAAKAAARVAETDHDRVIAEDRAALLRAQQEVQREKETTRTASTSGFQSRLDLSL